MTKRLTTSVSILFQVYKKSFRRYLQILISFIQDDDEELTDDDTFDYDHTFFDRDLCKLFFVYLSQKNKNLNLLTFILIQVPDECENEIVGIESLNACFTRRYNFCPSFFPGSLQNAFQAAFTSQVIKEVRLSLILSSYKIQKIISLFFQRRPVLVHIHHDQSMFSNIFCSNIFCSEIIIEYLLENYIVWSWDITFESNKNK